WTYGDPENWVLLPPTLLDMAAGGRSGCRVAPYLHLSFTTTPLGQAVTTDKQSRSARRRRGPIEDTSARRSALDGIRSSLMIRAVMTAANDLIDVGASWMQACMIVNSRGSIRLRIGTA